MTATDYDLIGSVTQPNLSNNVASLAFDDEGEHVYVLGQEIVAGTAVAHLNTFDVTDPTTPTLVDTLDLPGSGGGGTTGINSIFHGVACTGDYLYFSTGSFWPDGSGWLWVVDISTRDAPADVGPIARVAGWESEALCAPGDGYLYASFRRALLDQPARLRIYDLATPSAPSLVGSLTFSNAADYAQGHGLAVGGDLAVVATDWAAFPFAEFVDVSNRAAPTLVTAASRISPPLEQTAIDAAGTTAYYQYDGGSPSYARTADDTGATLGTVDISSLGGRAAYWDDAGSFVVIPGHGIVDVSVPSAPSVAVVTADSFNKDWAADYSTARRLTATCDDANTSRLDIGRVTVPGGWIVGSIAIG